MAVDLGLDHLIDNIKNLPANSLGFASNTIALLEQAFRSDRNPFGGSAILDPTTPVDPNELALDAVASISITLNVVASEVLPAARGGSGNYTYTLTDSDDTPFDVPGLMFDPATRIISGTPTTLGEYPVKYSVNDGMATLSRVFNINVVSTQTNLMLQRAPQDRTLNLNVPFSTITFPGASGGSGNYTFSVEGSIPPGMMFDGATRQMSGTPSQTGTFAMTYVVNDGTDTDSEDFIYTVVSSGGPVSGTHSATDADVEKTDPPGTRVVVFVTTVGAFDFPDSWFESIPPDNLRFEVEIRNSDGQLEIVISGGVYHFVSLLEDNLFITISSPSATDFTVRGPNHSTNQTTDTTEAYRWIPDAAGAAAAIAFVDAMSDGDSMTVTFRYNT